MLHAADGVEEVVLVDSREDRIRNLARSYKTAPWHNALAPALAHVDAVVVATPPSTHVAVALQAIEAGKHVLVEKPLAPTSEGARRLESAARAAGVVPRAKNSARCTTSTVPGSTWACTRTT